MQKIIEFINRYRRGFFYIFSAVFIIKLLLVITPDNTIKSMADTIEKKTFDIRQKVISKHRNANKDIVIAVIDDSSYEYLIETYGSWPVPRYIYAEILDYIQAQNPKYTVFDLLFVKSLKNSEGSDEKLAEAFKKYPNTYTAVNFDNSAFEIRKPPLLDKKLSTDIVSLSKTLDPYEFSNCRAIIPEITDATPNIGHINIFKSDDGFIRRVPIFVNYPEYDENLSPKSSRSYLYMTVKLAADYLNKYENQNITEFKVDKNNNFILGNRIIPMTENAEAVLNWYGESGLKNKNSFTYIPMWKIIKSMNAQKDGIEPLLPPDTFKDKIVYIGTSVLALSDIKTVPLSKYMPGVEIHAVLLNNIIDNDIIKELPPAVNALAAIIAALIAAFLVIRIKSVYLSLSSLIIMTACYLYLSVFLMQKYNLWIWIVIPLAAAAAGFILAFLIKYLITSRDFEHMYKLAATDGLTELYNHRFFQEQLRKEIAAAEKNKTKFSLIMTDIDFFKKFNDNYGHQAGDAVLKHIAKTLKSCVRKQDFVCRYGGEEMAVILNGADRETAVRIAKNICSTAASKTYALSPELEVKITISLGAAAYPDNGKTPAELIEYADKCLYAAKENGRNQVGFIE